MPPKQRKNRAKAPVVKENPRIVELKDFDELKKFAPDVPEETLIEQISRQQGGVPTTSRPPPQGGVPTTSRPPPQLDIENDPELGFVGRFMFKLLDYTAYMIPLLSVHLVLNVLVRMQYGQDVEWDVIAKESAATAPVLGFLHYFFDPLKTTRLFKIASFVVSIAIGGYLLYASNEEGYYFVMKRAPPLGTIWVWLFIEMEWEYSAVSLAVIGVYMWLCDYRF